MSKWVRVNGVRVHRGYGTPSRLDPPMMMILLLNHHERQSRCYMNWIGKTDEHVIERFKMKSKGAICTYEKLQRKITRGCGDDHRVHGHDDGRARGGLVMPLFLAC